MLKTDYWSSGDELPTPKVIAKFYYIWLGFLIWFSDSTKDWDFKSSVWFLAYSCSTFLRFNAYQDFLNYS